MLIYHFRFSFFFFFYQAIYVGPVHGGQGEADQSRLVDSSFVSKGTYKQSLTRAATRK